VQLSAALELHAQIPLLILVSADDDLNHAPLAEGLLVENPNDHP
jgi:hypothetical protein